MKNATSHNRRDSPNWTARNATILAGFRVPAIDSLRAGAMNVTNVYADNSTTLGLLAVSQNGTTENFTAESALVKNTIEYGVQVNGKIRARIELPIDMPKEEVEAAAKAHKDVVPFLEGKTVRKVIVVKNIVNIVVA